jgi:hypothetical protein
MSEKLMLIVPAELVAKIDANRGDLSQAEFINFLIDSLINEKSEEKRGMSKGEINSIKEDLEKKYATKEEFQALIQDNRKLLKSFLDFFIEYGLFMSKQSGSNELIEITSKLKGLEENLIAEEGGEVKIKWK